MTVLLKWKGREIDFEDSVVPFSLCLKVTAVIAIAIVLAYFLFYYIS